MKRADGCPAIPVFGKFHAECPVWCGNRRSASDENLYAFMMACQAKFLVPFLFMTMSIEKYLSKAWFPHFLIGLIAFLVWGKTIRFDFVWDDHLFITENPSIRSLKNIPEMFYSLEAQASRTAPLFRRLRTAHFAILNALTGK